MNEFLQYYMFIYVYVGETALIMASAHGHASVVRLLLFSGSDVNIRTKSGHSALTLASYR